MIPQNRVISTRFSLGSNLCQIVVNGRIYKTTTLDLARDFYLPHGLGLPKSDIERMGPDLDQEIAVPLRDKSRLGLD